LPRRPAQSSGSKPARSASANAGSGATLGSGGGPRLTAVKSPGQAPIILSDLYRGWPRLGLIRDLAFGEFSPAELAASIGCTIHDILEFRADHEDEIAETRAALAGQLAIETAGLWIAKKQNRLAELQADTEDLRGCIEKLRDEDKLGGQQHRDIVKTRVTLLKAVADELSPRATGIKPRTEETGNVVRYVIEDPDIEAMK
jgi:hypothetical protein